MHSALRVLTPERSAEDVRVEALLVFADFRRIVVDDCWRDVHVDLRTSSCLKRRTQSVTMLSTDTTEKLTQISTQF